MLLDKFPADQGSENIQAWLKVWKCHVWVSICEKGAELPVEISGECCQGRAGG